MIFILGAGLLGLLAWGCFALAGNMDRKRLTIERDLMTKFSPDILAVDDGMNALGFRSRDATIIVADRSGDAVIPADRLLAVEVELDGLTVDRADRGSQLLGAAVGGALFGGLGAAVGGLSGDRIARPHTKAVKLKLLFDHPRHNALKVCFGAWPGTGLPSDAEPVRQACSRLEQFRSAALAAMRGPR